MRKLLRSASGRTNQPEKTAVAEAKEPQSPISPTTWETNQQRGAELFSNLFGDNRDAESIVPSDGYMEKKSSRGTWQSRWMAFQAPYHLCYWKTQPSTSDSGVADDPDAIIDLRRVRRLTFESMIMTLKFSSRTYYLRARSKVQLHAWGETIRRVMLQGASNRRDSRVQRESSTQKYPKNESTGTNRRVSIQKKAYPPTRSLFGGRRQQKQEQTFTGSKTLKVSSKQKRQATDAEKKAITSFLDDSEDDDVKLQQSIISSNGKMTRIPAPTPPKTVILPTSAEKKAIASFLDDDDDDNHDENTQGEPAHTADTNSRKVQINIMPPLPPPPSSAEKKQVASFLFDSDDEENEVNIPAQIKTVQPTSAEKKEMSAFLDGSDEESEERPPKIHSSALPQPTSADKKAAEKKEMSAFLDGSDEESEERPPKIHSSALPQPTSADKKEISSFLDSDDEETTKRILQTPATEQTSAQKQEMTSFLDDSDEESDDSSSSVTTRNVRHSPMKKNCSQSSRPAPFRKQESISETLGATKVGKASTGEKKKRWQDRDQADLLKAESDTEDDDDDDDDDKSSTNASLKRKTETTGVGNEGSDDDDDDDDDDDNDEMKDFLQGSDVESESGEIKIPTEKTLMRRASGTNIIEKLSDGGLIVKTKKDGAYGGEPLKVPSVFARPDSRLRSYRALAEVNGLRFPNLPLEQQIAMFETLKEREFKAGENIITQNDRDGGFFIITGPTDDSEVQVWKKVDDDPTSQEKMLTHLSFGACVGERGVFIHPRNSAPRSASVRAFSSRVTCLEIKIEHFSYWQPFRISLILGEVPLLQKLPKKARDGLQTKLQFKKIKRGEYLFKEGDIGDMFYMVVRGEVQLTDQANGAPPTPPRVLVTLGEGHYFGEMSLVMGEPRNCSVHCVTPTVELACLSKSDFESGLSAVENFRSIINEVTLERERTREAREKRFQKKSRLASRSSSNLDIESQSQNHNDSSNSISSITSAGSESYGLRRHESGNQWSVRSLVSKNRSFRSAGGTPKDSSIESEYQFNSSDGAGITGETGNSDDTASSREIRGTTFFGSFVTRSKSKLQMLITRSSSNRDMEKCFDEDDDDNDDDDDDEVEMDKSKNSENMAITQNSASITNRKHENDDASVLSLESTSTNSTVVRRRSITTGVLHINDYKRVSLLGKGSYGDVYKVEDLRATANNNGEKAYYALKVLDQKRSASTAIAREIAVLKKLNHRNLVRLHEVLDDPNDSKVYLVMELVEQGELIGDVLRCEPFPMDLSRKYFRDVTCGLAYLHVHGVIHCDLKPQNLFLTAHGDIKIADFGSATFDETPGDNYKSEEVEAAVVEIASSAEGAAERKRTGTLAAQAALGTPLYMAPELFKCSSSYGNTEFVTPAVDIWSLGATLFMMVCGQPPWNGRNELDLSNKIMNVELTFPNSTDLDPHAMSLMRKMLVKEPEERIMLHEVFMSDWVTQEGINPVELNEDDFVAVTVTKKEINSATTRRPSSATASFPANSTDYSSMETSGSTIDGSSIAQSRPGGVRFNSDLNLEYDFSADDNDDAIIDNDNESDDQVSEDGIGNSGSPRSTLSSLTASTSSEYVTPSLKAAKRKSGNRVISKKKPSSRNNSPHQRARSNISAKGTTIASKSGSVSKGNAKARTARRRTRSVSNTVRGSPRGRTRSVSDSDSKSKLRKDGSRIRSKSVSSDGTKCTDNSDRDSSLRTLSKHKSFNKTMTSTTESALSANLRSVSSRRHLTSASSVATSTSSTIEPRHGPRVDNISSGSEGLSDVGSLSFINSSGIDQLSDNSIKRHQSMATHLLEIDSDDSDDSDEQDYVLEKVTRKETASAEDLATYDAAMDFLNTAIAADEKKGTNGTRRKTLGGHASLAEAEAADLLVGEVQFRPIGVEDDDIDPWKELEKKRQRESRPTSKGKLREPLASKNRKKKNATSPEQQHLNNLTAQCSAPNAIQVRNWGEQRNLQSTFIRFGTKCAKGQPKYQEDRVVSIPFFLSESDLEEVEDGRVANLATVTIGDKDSRESRGNSIVAERRLKEEQGKAKGQSPLEVRQKSIERKFNGKDCFEDTPPRLAAASFMAVYDGHGGDEVCEMLEAELHSSVKSHLLAMSPSTPSGGEVERRALLDEAFCEAFRKVDEEIVLAERVRIEQEQRERKSALQTSRSAGSTAVVLLLYRTTKCTAGLETDMQPILKIEKGKKPVKVSHATKSTSSAIELSQDVEEANKNNYDDGLTHLLVANVGDCRVVLSRSGQAVALSDDHKVTNPSERKRLAVVEEEEKRINKSNNEGEGASVVHEGRLFGVLAVSRSFGDSALKKKLSKSTSKDAPVHNSKEALIAEPDITHTWVTRQDEFIIVASDGLWDCLSNQQAVNFVRRRLIIHKCAQRVAGELVQEAIDQGSRDNTSAIICMLHQHDLK